MTPLMSRRRFVVNSSALSLLGLVPRGVFGASNEARRVVVRTDDEIGLVRPELHGHFAEHLGSCVYGGLWVVVIRLTRRPSPPTGQFQGLFFENVESEYTDRIEN